MNGGKARIIASPKLSPEDVAALAQGDDALRDATLRSTLQISLDELELTLENDTLSAIAWMVADGLLEFRVACPSNDLDGDFHDKFGVFIDAAGDAIAFHGSPNDSAKAFRNYESISVFYSWIDSREAERVVYERKRFDRLWDNVDPNVRSYALPDAIKRNLIEFRDRAPRPYAPVPVSKEDRRWRHQKEALACFLETRCGVLEMATGTGKTRTAVNIMNELFERGSTRTAIVAAAGTDLLDQWYGVLAKEGRPVYRAYERHNDAQGYLNDPVDSVLLTSRLNLPRVLPRLSAGIQKDALIVCDEVHGMGAPSMVENLPGLIRPLGWRLGLSATPDREYDQAGNDFIEAEIGPTIFEFGLEKAIRRGILCEFDYLDLEYEFSAEDKADVRQAIRRYHARARAAAAPPIESLYQEIARIRKLSREKLPPFAALIAERPEILERSLIFVETADYGLEVQEILLRTGIDFHTYYADDARGNLTRFARGDLSCLITCHRISEGIDIRSVGTIILFASAKAQLETVQRLGRCLRVDPSDPDKRALVVDFIRTDDVVEDDVGGEASADMGRRDWFRRLSAVSREE
ncbi:DEAD/DEAH box helicase family protein [Sphingomonas aerolata]|uniref:DEAD/DEAH box helicase family protein n=1 Tax=Sphingomonas aerolata TaxID=185951 RepID=UPI002FE2A18A